MLEKFRLEMDEFLNRLLMEGVQNTRFTWLIGAGMSVTAGMPLAKDISRRIVVLEHLGSRRVRGELTAFPWEHDSVSDDAPYSEGNLNAFFEWYENDLGEEERRAHIDEAMASLSEAKPAFRRVTADEPASYPLVFEHLLGSTDTHRRFLTHLNSRVPGINLAHLCLAGLLKDYPHLGHTVFTTNFDDLVLKAILSLNHTARVFGELDSRDLPRQNEIYPQIVHLHGRHTGYRLVNTREQLKKVELNNPELKSNFQEFIRQSHLIVLGYSGWDDLVTSTLKKWPQNPSLLGGTLYWVPYRGDENEIHPGMREFLSQAPPHQVKLIVDKEAPLSADSFMLRLLDTIARKAGGFRRYRREFLEYAQNQHTIFLAQLKAHPQFDPESALRASQEAVRAAKAHDLDAARSCLVKTRAFGDIEDVHNSIRAATFHNLGLVYMCLSEYKDAERYLNESLLLWDTLKGQLDDAELKKAHTFRALGELYLRTANLTKAEEKAKNSLYFFNLLEVPLGVAFAFKLLGDINLRLSKPPAAKRDYTQALDGFLSIGHSFGAAICQRSLGEVALSENPMDAIDLFSRALAKFTRHEDTLGMANCLRGLGAANIQVPDYPVAERFLDEAKAIYVRLAHDLGTAQVLQALADLKIRRNMPEAGVLLLNEAISLLEGLGASHSIGNVIGDLIKCYQSLENVDGLESIRHRAKTDKSLANHTFLQYVLGKAKDESSLEEKPQ